MKDRFSEAEVVTAVIRLTNNQLLRFIDGEFVKPKRATGGYIFSQIDIARLELLCDLSLDFDLDEINLSIVISLIDQLHTARQDLVVMAQAVDKLPSELRASVMASLRPS